MMEQVGYVIAIEGNQARLLVKRMMSCGSNCAACKASCGAKPLEILVENKIGAKVGDRVEIMSSTSNVMKILLILYMLPFLSLCIGIFLGLLLLEKKTEYYELYSFGLGLLFMTFGYWMIRKIDREYRKKNQTILQITRILPEEH